MFKALPVEYSASYGARGLSGWVEPRLGTADCYRCDSCGEELVLASAQLQLRADVFPEPDGGCAVAFYRGEQKVEVRVHSDGQNFDFVQNAVSVFTLRT